MWPVTAWLLQCGSAGPPAHPDDRGMCPAGGARSWGPRSPCAKRTGTCLLLRQRWGETRSLTAHRTKRSRSNCSCSSCCAVPWVARGAGARQFAAAKNSRDGVQPAMLRQLIHFVGVLEGCPPPSGQRPASLGPPNPDPWPTHVPICGEGPELGAPKPQRRPQGRGRAAGRALTTVRDSVCMPSRSGCYTNSSCEAIAAQGCSKQLRTAEGA